MSIDFFTELSHITKEHCEAMGYDVPLSPPEALGRLSDDEVMRITRDQRRMNLIRAEGALLSNPTHSLAICDGVYLDSNGQAGYLPRIES